ncbi:MAG: TraB/GumN family protein [Comamonas sp.]|nr:TraB/GumN family protein [Comamonas sp.]
MRAFWSPTPIKRGLLAAALALWAGLAPAAEAPACPPKAAMPAPAQLQQLAARAQDRGLLWRVRHGTHTSWLYGTMHVSRLDWFMPGPEVVSALRGADKLALELDVLDPQVLAELEAGLKAREGAPALAAPLAARLEQQLRLACAEADVARLRPEAQVLSLLAQAGRRQGLDPSYGVDLILAGAARAMGKPVIGLETPQLQLKDLVSDDPKEVAEAVDDGLKQLESGKAGPMMVMLAEMWSEGRQEKLESYAQWCDCVNTPRERAQLKRMLDGRNPGMADGIVSLLKQGDSVFAAVGALHMVGPGGLPALLRKKGYQVERVKFPAHTPPKSESKPVETP